jgi:hypothetical protein
MKFRNYGIVVMGNMESVKDDIVKIAETSPRYIDAKGVLIATFASVMEPPELKDFFNFNGRSFFLFDLDDQNSGYHMDNEKLHNHLFGYLTNQGDQLKNMSDRLMTDISATTKENKGVTSNNIPKDVIESMRRHQAKGRTKTKKKQPIKVHISDMTKKEREKIVNRILDKGFSKLTNSDKNILKKISELK